MAGRGVEDERYPAGRDHPQGAGELPSRFTEFAGWVVDWGQGSGEASFDLVCVEGRVYVSEGGEPWHRIEGGEGVRYRRWGEHVHYVVGVRALPAPEAKDRVGGPGDV